MIFRDTWVKHIARSTLSPRVTHIPSTPCRPRPRALLLVVRRLAVKGLRGDQPQQEAAPGFRQERKVIYPTAGLLCPCRCYKYESSPALNFSHRLFLIILRHKVLLLFSRENGGSESSRHLRYMRKQSRIQSHGFLTRTPCSNTRYLTFVYTTHTWCLSLLFTSNFLISLSLYFSVAYFLKFYPEG